MGFFGWLKEMLKLALFAAWRWVVRWYRGKPRREDYVAARRPISSPRVSREYTPRHRPPPTLPSENPVYTVRHPNNECTAGNYQKARGIIYGNDFADPYQRVRASSRDYPANGIRLYTPESPYRGKLNSLYDNINNIIYRRKRRREDYI